MGLLVLLSPAKNMREAPPFYPFSPTMPAALDSAEALLTIARGLSPSDIKALMGVSDAIADLNARRFAEFSRDRFSPEAATPALLAFNGDVYKNIATAAYGEGDFAAAQRRVRILSGLYGLLRPFDLILPYRLEMGVRLKNPHGACLYDFWRGRMGALLANALAETGAGTVINLASQEYFKAAAGAVRVPVITAHFKEAGPKGLRTVGVLAKKARGAMADYIIRRRIDDAAAVKNFSENGYVFSEKDSSDSEWTFVR